MSNESQQQRSNAFTSDWKCSTCEVLNSWRRSSCGECNERRFTFRDQCRHEFTDQEKQMLKDAVPNEPIDPEAIKRAKVHALAGNVVQQAGDLAAIAKAQADQLRQLSSGHALQIEELNNAHETIKALQELVAETETTKDSIEGALRAEQQRVARMESDRKASIETIDKTGAQLEELQRSNSALQREAKDAAHRYRDLESRLQDERDRNRNLRAVAVVVSVVSILSALVWWL